MLKRTPWQGLRPGYRAWLAESDHKVRQQEIVIYGESIEARRKSVAPSVLGRLGVERDRRSEIE